nr:RNA-dependent RNA polymerase [buhirugu virus 18]
MPKNNEIKFEDLFNLPNPGLRSYFDIVRKGQPDEYRTTFARGSTIEEVLREWEPQLDSLSDKWPTLVEFENDLKSKVGPMSVMKPLKDRLADIESYYEGILLPSEPVSERAVKAVIREWSPARGLHLRNQSKTVENMKLSTNSGSPYFTKRRLVCNKTVPAKVWQSELSTFQNLTGYLWNACAVLGWRGQEGGRSKDDVKQRVVWMFPFGVNVQELQVYQPLVEAAQRFNLVPAWVSMEAVNDQMTRLFDTKGHDDLIICTDFSKFDQHFNESLSEVARAIISAIFTDAREWLTRVFPIKYAIPLAYDYGKVRTGKHGMASGSGGTNADETLAHRALQYEAAQRQGQRLNPNSMCLGDDGVLTYPGITSKDVMQSYSSHGLVMNADKQYESTQDCTFLKRWHHKDYRVNHRCVGVYSTFRALGRLMEQERYYDPEVWSSKMVALRQLSILENVKYHPLRDQFAEFCMARDKYRLGIDIPGFLDDIELETKKAIDLMPDFLGYTKSIQEDVTNPETGISKWWIVT